MSPKTKIIVQTMLPHAETLRRCYEVDKNDYDKFSEVAMEAMTRAVEEVIDECKLKSNSQNTHSKRFIKCFFSSFGPLMWAFKDGEEDKTDSHYSTLTELALRNAGYGALSEFVSKCTKKTEDDMDDEDLL